MMSFTNRNLQQNYVSLYVNKTIFIWAILHKNTSLTNNFFLIRQLLKANQYSEIEKIKTIGTTYMAASGLSTSEGESDNDQHIQQLADFTLAMKGVVATVNKHSKFTFKIRAGEHALE